MTQEAREASGMNDQVDPEQAQNGSMTFWEHLNELRSRLVKMILAFIVGSVIAWWYKEPLLKVITGPFITAWNENELPGVAKLHYPAPASLFIAYIKLSVLAGLIFALPIMLYQVWAFVAPGLYSREKRFAVPFVGASCGLFALGGYFGFKVAFPAAFQYLLGFSVPGSPDVSDAGNFAVEPTVMIGDYMDFIIRMLLAFGAVFELPVLVFFLSVAGIVNHTHLIKFARYFIVIAFVLGAIITPPDPASQLFLAVPLCLLYVFSIGIAWLFGKRPPRVT